MPRRGRGTVFHGRLRGTTNEIGPLYRVKIFSTDPGASQITEMISQNGPQPRTWVYSETTHAPARELGLADILDPLVDGLQYSSFDLQMPFIYWDDYVYEGTDRTKGRKAHSFLLYPPDIMANNNLEIGAVRVYLDAKFNALLKADILDPGGNPIRSFKIISLKKLQNQMIPRVIDLVDVSTRNKIRFTVVAAAMNLHLPATDFQPRELGTEPSEIPLNNFRFFE